MKVGDVVRGRVSGRLMVVLGDKYMGVLRAGTWWHDKRNKVGALVRFNGKPQIDPFCDTLTDEEEVLYAKLMLTEAE